MNTREIKKSEFVTQTRSTRVIMKDKLYWSRSNSRDIENGMPQDKNTDKTFDSLVGFCEVIKDKNDY